MSQARSVTATFTLDPVFFTLDVTLAGDGSGSVGQRARPGSTAASDCERSPISMAR